MPTFRSCSATSSRTTPAWRSARPGSSSRMRAAPRAPSSTGRRWRLSSPCRRVIGSARSTWSQGQREAPGPPPRRCGRSRRRRACPRCCGRGRATAAHRRFRRFASASRRRRATDGAAGGGERACPGFAPGVEADLRGEEILAAEEVPFDEGAPLEATEVPADEGGALFDSPLPPAPPQAPAPTEPAVEEPPPAPGRSAAAPLTAPPPAEYQTDLPSIPLATSEEPEGSADAEPAPLLSESPPAPAPPPARARPGTRGRRQGRRKQRSSIPIVPVAGGLTLVLALGAAGWWFFLRPGTEVATPAPPPTAAQSAPSAQAAPPPGTPHVSALEPNVALPGETILIRARAWPTRCRSRSAELGGDRSDDRGAPGRDARPPTDRGAENGAGRSGRRHRTGARGAVRGPVPARPAARTVSRTDGRARGDQGTGLRPRSGWQHRDVRRRSGLVLTASTSEIAAVAPEIPLSESPEVPVVVTVGGRASSDQVQYFVSRATTSSFTPGSSRRRSPAIRASHWRSSRRESEPVLLPRRSGRKRVDGVARGGGVDGPEPPRCLGALEEDRDRVPASTRSLGGRRRRGRSVPHGDRRGCCRVLAGLGVRIALGSTGGSPQSCSALGGPPAGLLRPVPVQGAPASHAGPLPTLRVFIDIYSAARRRSGGRGIATSIVYPPTEAMAEALRQAALVVSNRTPREEVAINGRWEGNINDPDTGTRRFEVLIEVADKGVTGSMKTCEDRSSWARPCATSPSAAAPCGSPSTSRARCTGSRARSRTTRSAGLRLEKPRPASFTLEYAE